MNRFSQSQPQRGFTLIEVLIALVVAAIALSALSRALGVSAQSQSYLEEKIVATWVAQNTLLQLQLEGAQGNFAERQILFGREWQVSREIENTELADFKKLRIDVRAVVNNQAADRVSSRLISVVGQP
ncbi:MAG: type II secretion system minor pseudopilin GspI [Thiotrichales bacterium]|nr:type II secretion system minor pseudopilin GspI [Thiotrichales bacterium]